MFKVTETLFLAPMAGYTDDIFRMVCRGFGCDITVSEMVHSGPLSRGQKGSMNLMKRSPEDRPFGVQLYGGNPEEFRLAALRISSGAGAEFIDINCGCPVRKIMRRGEGSALLKDPVRIGRIVEAVKKSVSLPVSVKIRLGQSPDDRNYAEVCRAAEDSGADFIVVHGRELSRLFSGPADLEALAEIKRRVRVPVVANGGIVDFESYRTLRATGCDAVMIGRAALVRPWVFASIKARISGAPYSFGLADGLELFRRHASLLVDRLGPPDGLRAFRAFSMGYMKAMMEDSGVASDRSFLRRFHGVSTMPAFYAFVDSFAEYCSRTGG